MRAVMPTDSGPAGKRGRGWAILRLRTILAALAVAGLLLASRQEPGLAASGARAPAATLHYAANMAEGERSFAAGLGFTLFDTGPGRGEVDSLADGQRALVWVGAAFDDCRPETRWSEFTAAVDTLAGDPKVYGWYLYDEPNLNACSGLLKEIRRRADYIKAHAPGQKSFVAAVDGGSPEIAPSSSHVDLIGLDPYPCRRDNGCDFKLVDKSVAHATASGIPKSAIVPIIQTFGQSCDSGEHIWKLPTAAQLRTILAHWDGLVPNPAFDYVYSWDNQDEWSCPTLVDADGGDGLPDLQSVMKKHNRTGAGSPPPPSSFATDTTEAPSSTTGGMSASTTVAQCQVVTTTTQPLDRTALRKPQRLHASRASSPEGSGSASTILSENVADMRGAALPFTGSSNIAPLLVAGCALLGLGTSLLSRFQRRTRDHER